MTLADTGPLVAIVIADDRHHADALKTLCVVRLPLLIPLPCLVEALHLVGAAGGYAAQEELWRWHLSGALTIHSLTAAEIERARVVMATYRDTPCDFADAALVAAAENLSVRRVFTFDSHFFAYRLADGSALEVVPNPST